MKLSHFISAAVFSLFAINVSATCVDFLLHNHTHQILHLTKDPQSDAICKMPNNILPGKTGVLSIKKTDVIPAGEVSIIKKHPAYISIKTFLNNQQYNLFEEFEVDQHGQRIINEELISKKTALSWENNKHDIHLCSTKQFSKHNTCVI